MGYKELKLFKHKTKADHYISKGRRKWSDLDKSIKHFLKKSVFNGKSVLEIGCAAGGLYEILRRRFGSMKFTGTDISPDEIKVARKRYPDAEFSACDFYSNKFKSNSFDTVASFLVVHHQRDYKKFISELIRISKSDIIFDVRLKSDGQTVVDLDASYLYYHGTGKRNYYCVYNMYEFLNFLHLDKFDIKSISIYGYYPPKKTSAFVPMPKSKMITAAVHLKKYKKGERIKRWGGHPQFAERDWCKLDVKIPGFKAADF
ncbi:MAG: class I SAM-dependent methyltransferase [Candidatus Omnitrophica bacterium]|nr:class I SAM-dependent methyltransferase [Candidatus Omnitrophota bacterium]